MNHWTQPRRRREKPPLLVSRRTTDLSSGQVRRRSHPPEDGKPKKLQTQPPREHIWAAVRRPGKALCGDREAIGIRQGGNRFLDPPGSERCCVGLIPPRGRLSIEASGIVRGVDQEQPWRSRLQQQWTRGIIIAQQHHIFKHHIKKSDTRLCHASTWRSLRYR